MKIGRQKEKHMLEDERAIAGLPVIIHHNNHYETCKNNETFSDSTKAKAAIFISISQAKGSLRVGRHQTTKEQTRNNLLSSKLHVHGPLEFIGPNYRNSSQCGRDPWPAKLMSQRYCTINSHGSRRT